MGSPYLSRFLEVVLFLRVCIKKAKGRIMTRWNGNPDLTKIQLQERKRRRMMMRRGLYGMPTPKGTHPRSFTSADEPVFKPMPRPSSPLDFIIGFLSLMPWARRRRRESELAEQQRSQSMKAKGR